MNADYDVHYDVQPLGNLKIGHAPPSCRLQKTLDNFLGSKYHSNAIVAWAAPQTLLGRGMSGSL